MNLKALQQAANEALERAAECKGDFGGDSVNWADLRCVSAERFEDEEGETGYRVWIEEAAPDCFALPQFVWKDLDAHGFPGVQVHTEW